ncbi:MAG: PaREP1 family protein [Sulfolobales archaeon]
MAAEIRREPQDNYIEEHLRLCEKLLVEAESLARQGDYIQASEKAWGAAAHIVKAVAAKRGLELRSNRDLWSFVAELVRETGDDELRRLWNSANGFHINFYEAWMPGDMVWRAIEDVELFVEKLKKLI